MPKPNRTIRTPQSLNAYIKNVCDIMRRSGRAGALQYVPELTWLLFLSILDEREAREAEHAQAVGAEFQPSLEYPYRWRDWASPDGEKRIALQLGTLGGFMSFVNGELIPHLKHLKDKNGATPRQKIISEVFSYVEKTGIDTRPG
jgi:type I restriction enzyme M protein